MVNLEVIDKLWIELPDSVTIHCDTAEPDLYDDENNIPEFMEYVCYGKDDDITYEIRVYTVLEQGKVYINALVDGEIVKEDYADPLTDQPMEIVRRFEKEFNETTWIVE